MHSTRFLFCSATQATPGGQFAARIAVYDKQNAGSRDTAAGSPIKTIPV
jgi:hypothetical protein